MRLSTFVLQLTRLRDWYLRAIVRRNGTDAAESYCARDRSDLAGVVCHYGQRRERDEEEAGQHGVRLGCAANDLVACAFLVYAPPS